MLLDNIGHSGSPADERGQKKKKSCTNGSDHTDPVAGLLDENLGKLDQRIIVFEHSGEIYHPVGHMQLIASRSSVTILQGTERNHG